MISIRGLIVVCFLASIAGSSASRATRGWKAEIPLPRIEDPDSILERFLHRLRMNRLLSGG